MKRSWLLGVAALAAATVWRSHAAPIAEREVGETFRDCAGCPEFIGGRGRTDAACPQQAT